LTGKKGAHSSLWLPAPSQNPQIGFKSTASPRQESLALHRQALPAQPLHVASTKLRCSAGLTGAHSSLRPPVYEQKPLGRVKGSTVSHRCMSPALHSRGQALHLKLSLSGARAPRGTLAARRTRRATRAGAQRPMKCLHCRCARDCWPPGSALPHPARLAPGSAADMRIWRSPSRPAPRAGRFSPNLHRQMCTYGCRKAAYPVVGDSQWPCTRAKLSLRRFSPLSSLLHLLRSCRLTLRKIR
jgi:hypothetical protein